MRSFPSWGADARVRWCSLTCAPPAIVNESLSCGETSLGTPTSRPRLSPLVGAEGGWYGAPVPRTPLPPRTSGKGESTAGAMHGCRERLAPPWAATAAEEVLEALSSLPSTMLQLVSAEGSRLALV